MDNINILYWNANGLSNKIHEVPRILCKYDVHVVLVNETKFSKKDNINPTLLNYKLYRRDRETFGGGIAIYVKSNMPHCEIPTISTQFKSHAIQLNNKLVIVSAYLGPNKKLVTKELDNFLNLGKSVMVVGDFNCKHLNWHCRKSNANGRILDKYVQRKSIALAFPDENTLFPYNGGVPSVVDLAIIKNLKNYNKPNCLNDLDSDHKPILLNINKYKIQTIQQKYLNYKKANWPKFKSTLNKTITINNNLKNVEDLENCVENITDVIQNAITLSIPTNTVKMSQEDFPQEIVRRSNCEITIDVNFKKPG